MATQTKRAKRFHEMSRGCDWPAALRNMHELADVADTLASELEDLEWAADKDVLASGDDTPAATVHARRVRLDTYSKGAENARRVLESLDSVGSSMLREWQAAQAEVPAAQEYVYDE